MKTAKEITKGSTLLATLNDENFPFGQHQDLIDDLHRMINLALNQKPIVKTAEEILKEMPSVKQGLDDFYGRQTVLNGLNLALNHNEPLHLDSVDYRDFQSLNL